jgi:DHA1 family tetracycline resistance protein-like MFS transporter
VLVRPVIRALGERRAAALGIGTSVLEFLCFVFITKGWMVFVVLGIFLPLQSFTHPALNGMMSRRVDDNAQGELQGFNGSLAALAAIVAPVVYTPVIAWFISPAAPFRLPGIGFLIAATAGAAALAILLGVRGPRGAPTPIPAQS